MTDADILREQLAALGLSQRGAADLLEIGNREFRGYCMGERVPQVVKLAMLYLMASKFLWERDSAANIEQMKQWIIEVKQ